MKEKIMIRKGNASQEPMVVYVEGVNQLESFVCHKLNTGDVVFSEKDGLIEFDFITFKRMYYEWKIKNIDVVKLRFEQSLSEIN